VHNQEWHGHVYVCTARATPGGDVAAATPVRLTRQVSGVGRGLTAAAAVVVALGAVAVTGWREHRLHATPVSAPRHQPPPGPAAAIRFTSDQGIILTRPGARYQHCRVSRRRKHPAT